MNCDEYKQAVGADPSFDGGAGHLSDCPSCQEYRRDMQALDQKIGRALALEVPELTMPSLDDVDTGNVVTLESRRPVSMKAWFSVAATVALAVFIGFRYGPDISPEYASLGDEVLAHVTHEPAALLVTDFKVSDEHLSEVVPASIANIDHSSGLITFAETCPISGYDVPHLVIQGEHGPITIMLLPNEKISEAITLNDENSHGVILPVGDGSIAIVGSREEKLEDVQKQILQSVTWET
jgi:hypothetical protein